MATAIVRPRPDGSVIEIVISDRSDGDFHIDAEPDGLAVRRALLMADDWAVVRQIHSDRVVEADPHRAAEADAIVSDRLGQPIAVQGADCAPIAFVTASGPIAVAHVGWRGLVGGVIEATIAQLRSAGSTVSEAIVGPVIGPECYEFSDADLARVADKYGDIVRATTPDGASALDMPAAIRAAMSSAGVDTVEFASGCTACEHAGFSHRARQEPERHVLVARIRAG